MTKSKQNNHEYFMTAETCRNRLFNLSDPNHLQNEDFHLDIDFDDIDEEDEDDD